MEKIIVKAPAKINIGLNIVSKRKDGFHNLETLFYPINDLCDKLAFEKSNKFEFNSDLPFDNIIVSAIKLLEETTRKTIPVKISLDKHIPIGAGLGGGSSDAATVLKTINNIYNLNLSNQALKTIALELGSDVPFFIDGKPSVGKSRGEDLTNIELKIEYPILLVNPGIHVSTKEAFSEINPEPAKLNYNDVATIPLQNYRDVIVNDFEKVIFKKHPRLEDIKNSLYSAGAIFALMSGSGSTLYGIFKNHQDAKRASEIFPENYFTFISYGNK